MDFAHQLKWRFLCILVTLTIFNKLLIPLELPRYTGASIAMGKTVDKVNTKNNCNAYKIPMSKYKILHGYFSLVIPSYYHTTPPIINTIPLRVIFFLKYW